MEVLNGKIIYKWWVFQHTKFDYQRVFQWLLESIQIHRTGKISPKYLKITPHGPGNLTKSGFFPDFNTVGPIMLVKPTIFFKLKEATELEGDASDAPSAPAASAVLRLGGYQELNTAGWTGGWKPLVWKNYGNSPFFTHAKIKSKYDPQLGPAMASISQTRQKKHPNGLAVAPGFRSCPWMARWTRIRLKIRFFAPKR